MREGVAGGSEGNGRAASFTWRRGCSGGRCDQGCLVMFFSFGGGGCLWARQKLELCVLYWVTPRFGCGGRGGGWSILFVCWWRWGELVFGVGREGWGGGRGGVAGVCGDHGAASCSSPVRWPRSVSLASPSWSD